MFCFSSAIQSTSSSVVLLQPDTNSGRSKSVLVRNESVRPSLLIEGDTIPKCDETLVESAVIREHRNVGRIENSGGGTMVSVVRPTCLRRAPTKVELLESQSRGSVPSLSVNVTEYVSQAAISTQRDSVDVDQFPEEYEEDIPSPISSVEEDRRMDPSHTCFLCKKFIGNKLLLLSHEKSHMCDIDASNNIICKYCSNPQDSITDMHLHYAQLEAELERHQKKDSNRKVLLCKQCGQMFTTDERLSAHLRFHADNMESTKHECKTCGETFMTRSKLAVHLWSHAVRPSNKTFKCHICGKGFMSKSAVMEHRLKHTAEEKSRAFKCVVCGMAFGNNTLLGKHRLTHSKKELARPFKCTFCDKAFARNHTLQIHHLTHSDQKSHLCSKCGKGFKMRNSLMQHLRTHQDPNALPKFPCNQCGAVFKVKSRLRDHLRLHSGERPYVCGICGKQFHKVTALHTHEISHTERRPYMCDICGKAFKWSKNLRQHKTIHLGLEGVIQSSVCISRLKMKVKCQPCQCEICGKQLSGKNSLRQHLANIHHQGTPLKRKASMCSICGKILSSSGALGRHIKVIHGGEKAFKCDFCNREYSTKVARDDHHRSHTGERPFACQACPKTFTSLSNLHIHRLIHSDDRPHKCTYCDKQFKRRAHLIPHIRTHTGEKPYVCSICNRSFTQSNDLNKHRLTHSNSKDHACHCGMAFRLKRDLKSHERRQHPIVQTLSAKIDSQMANWESKEDSKRIFILHSVQKLSLNTTHNSSSNVPVQMVDPPSVVVRNSEALVTVNECLSSNQPVHLR